MGFRNVMNFGEEYEIRDMNLEEVWIEEKYGLRDMNLEELFRDMSLGEV